MSTYDTPGDASALLVNDQGQYLLHLRDANKPIWQAGKWSLLGGGREPGETLDETIARELQEEAGLTIPDLRPFAVTRTTTTRREGRPDPDLPRHVERRR